MPKKAQPKKRHIVDGMKYERSGTKDILIRKSFTRRIRAVWLKMRGKGHLA